MVGTLIPQTAACPGAGSFNTVRTLLAENEIHSKMTRIMLGYHQTGHMLTLIWGIEMNNFYRFMFLTICTLSLVALAAGVASADLVTFTANLSGADEVPPVATAAIGQATFIFDTDAGFGPHAFHLDFSGLSSAQTGAHIHMAAVGVNGPVIIPLPLGSPVDNTVTLANVAEFGALSGGNLYVNVHSTNFPGGEIRGQLILTNVVSDANTTWGTIKALFR
jgi:hypothetical protein